MAVRKEYRDLTVGNIYRNGKSVPMLRVSGLWLEELGFKTGDFVKIKCENGQLIISLNEEKAQEKAAEKVFMDEEMKKLRKRYQREKEEICARYVAEGKAGVRCMKKDILTKVTFVVLIVIIIFFVMFGKEFMAVINGLIETESLLDQLLR